MGDRMENSQDFEDALAQGFAELRRDTPAPSAALMGRLVVDAKAAQRPRGLARLGTVLRGAFYQIGGMQGGAALAASAVLGIWLGYAQPVTLSSTIDTGSDTATADPLAMFEDFILEG